MKRKPKKRKNIIATHKTEKESLATIHKAVLQTMRIRQKPQEKSRHMSRHFTEEDTSLMNKHI